VAITFDPIKDAKNRRDRGLSLQRFADLDQTTALVFSSPRHGEDRRFILGMIDSVLHAAVTLDHGTDTHVISLRRASRRERRRYADATTAPDTAR
jgi:uncharacterized DUF497 family protein